MKYVDNIIDRFSPYLFWDVDKSTLDMEAHASYIIKRVLEYGQLLDWNIIRDYYSLPVIVSYARQLRELEPRALTYLSAQTPLSKHSDVIYETIEPQTLEL